MAKKASRSVGQRIRVPKTTDTKKPINYRSRLAEFNEHARYDGNCSSCIDNAWHHSQITRAEE